MLQTLHGGATARPFTTRSNALGIDLFLRIAPELFLKRALVGGVERVFEINRNFRNEGVDSTHSPEFAMLEFYQAYADYNDVAELTRAIVQNAAIALTGSTTVTLADGSECDVGGQWPRIALYESLSEAVGEEITPETPTQDLSDLAGSFGLDVDQARATSGKLVEEMWEATVQPSLHAPTFVVDFPGGEVGSVCPWPGTRHGVLGVERSGGATATTCRTSSASSLRRRGSSGRGGRRLPACHGVRHATGRWGRHGN